MTERRATWLLLILGVLGIVTSAGGAAKGNPFSVTAVVFIAVGVLGAAFLLVRGRSRRRRSRDD